MSLDIAIDILRGEIAPVENPDVAYFSELYWYSTFHETEIE